MLASKVINTILNIKDNMSGGLTRVSSKVQGLSKDAQRASKQVSNMANKFTAGADKMISKAAGLVKVGAGMAAVAGAAGGVALIKQSDVYAGIQARLKLINDGQQTVDQFNQKIFQSADKARISYVDIASSVGKLGIVAKSAFKNNDEILRFSELLAKNFKISGASTEEQSAAMYQLTQAMGAGKLQGDEFRSIMENAPMLAQAIAKEMNVPIGQLKEMGSEGKITSDIIKNALFHSADDINKKFEQMPVTFGEVATKIKSKLTEKLQPVYQQMSAWLNSSKGQESVNNITDALAKLASKLPDIINAISKLYDIISNLVNFIVKHRDAIEGFLVLIGGFMIGVKVAEALRGAIIGLQIAWGLFNGTLMLTPFGWVVLAITGLIAIGYLLWKNWDTVVFNLKKMWEDFKMSVAISIDLVIGCINRLIQGINRITGKHIVEIDYVETGQHREETRMGGHNALGTSYWKGGLTSVNERGGEIIDLPSGSRIIPADKSNKMLSGITFAKLADTIIIREDADINKIADAIVGKIEKHVFNM